MTRLRGPASDFSGDIPRRSELLDGVLRDIGGHLLALQLGIGHRR